MDGWKTSLSFMGPPVTFEEWAKKTWGGIPRCKRFGKDGRRNVGIWRKPTTLVGNDCFWPTFHSRKWFLFTKFPHVKRAVATLLGPWLLQGWWSPTKKDLVEEVNVVCRVKDPRIAEKVNQNTVTRDEEYRKGEFVSDPGNASLAFLINCKGNLFGSLNIWFSVFLLEKINFRSYNYLRKHFRFMQLWEVFHRVALQLFDSCDVFFLFGPCGFRCWLPEIPVIFSNVALQAQIGQSFKSMTGENAMKAGGGFKVRLFSQVF